MKKWKLSITLGSEMTYIQRGTSGPLTRTMGWGRFVYAGGAGGDILAYMEGGLKE